MTILITSSTSVEELADQLDPDKAEELILAIASRMADYDFTIGVIQQLIAELKKEGEDSGEPFSMKELEL